MVALVIFHSMLRRVRYDACVRFQYTSSLTISWHVRPVSSVTPRKISETIFFYYQKDFVSIGDVAPSLLYSLSQHSGSFQGFPSCLHGNLDCFCLLFWIFALFRKLFLYTFIVCSHTTFNNGWLRKGCSSYGTKRSILPALSVKKQSARSFLIRFVSGCCSYLSSFKTR